MLPFQSSTDPQPLISSSFSLLCPRLGLVHSHSLQLVRADTCPSAQPTRNLPRSRTLRPWRKVEAVRTRCPALPSSPCLGSGCPPAVSFSHTLTSVTPHGPHHMPRWQGGCKTNLPLWLQKPTPLWYMKAPSNLVLPASRNGTTLPQPLTSA